MNLLNKYGFTSREMEYMAPDPIRKMNRHSRIHFTIRLIGIIALVFLIGVIAFKFVAPQLQTRAEAKESFQGTVSIEYHGKQFQPGTYCGQAVLDHYSWGRDLSEELKKYCGL